MIREFFGGDSNLNCFALKQPCEDVSKLENLEELQEHDLTDEFRNKCAEIISTLKQEHVIKQINGRQLTGNMLLNLTMEYVDALNQDETLYILPAFERVVLIESERFSEKLFESIKDKITNDCSRIRMPFSESQLKRMQSRVIKSANQYLYEKLGKIVDCRNLVQLSQDIEERIRAYFKDILKENEQVSKTESLNFIQSTVESTVTPVELKDIDDVKPHLSSLMKAEYYSVI